MSKVAWIHSPVLEAGLSDEIQRRKTTLAQLSKQQHGEEPQIIITGASDFKRHSRIRNRRILLFEAVTAGVSGFEPLASEGATMVNSLGVHLQTTLAAELQLMCVPHHQARILPTLRKSIVTVEPDEIDRRFQQLVQAADAIVIVAPELCGELQRWVQQAMPYAPQLWTPPLSFTVAAADKWQSYQRLRAHHVPTPETLLLRKFQSLHNLHGRLPWAPSMALDSVVPFPQPWVVKPRDGAGSWGIRLIESREDERRWRAEMAAQTFSSQTPLRHSADWLIQPLLSGPSVSVNVVTGPRQTLAFPTCEQCFDPDHAFSYSGGALPIDASQDAAARSAARQAIQGLPAPAGLCGVDLVLVEEHGLWLPRVVDLNPRVTTSVAGLCASLRPSFGSIWSDVMLGTWVDEAQLHTRPCRFSSAGEVAWEPC